MYDNENFGVSSSRFIATIGLVVRDACCFGPNALNLPSLSITKIWSLISGLRYCSFPYEII